MKDQQTALSQAQATQYHPYLPSGLFCDPFQVHMSENPMQTYSVTHTPQLVTANGPEWLASVVQAVPGQEEDGESRPKGTDCSSIHHHADQQQWAGMTHLILQAPGIKPKL